MLPYRPNVAAILIDSQDQILIAERIDVAGAWQFPQGGVDKGETPLEALHRELEEEISIKPKYYQIEDTKDGYRYDFTPKSRRFGKYQGQQQTYFLCRLQKEPKAKSKIRVETQEQEFSQTRWIKPVEFQLSWVPDFKRPTYAQVLQDFFGVDFS